MSWTNSPKIRISFLITLEDESQKESERTKKFSVKEWRERDKRQRGKEERSVFSLTKDAEHKSPPHKVRKESVRLHLRCRACRLRSKLAGSGGITQDWTSKQPT